MSVPALGVLEVVFHLEGCTSLKERRARLAGLRDRLGRLAHVALREHRGDEHTRSCWTIAVLGADRRDLHSRLDGIERELEERVDAWVLDLQREVL